MNRSTVRMAIAILALVTAVIHIFIGFPLPDNLLFLLNGIGYLVLLAVFWLRPAPIMNLLRGREAWLHYIFIGYTALTLVLYFVINQAESFNNPVGLIDKAVELLLVVALWQDLRLQTA